MKALLKIKAWQLFTILIAPLVIKEFLPYGFSKLLDVLLSATFGIIIVLWFYLAGEYACKRLNKASLSLGFFRFNLILALVYAIGLGVLSVYRPTFNDLYYLIIPLHLYVMFACFYVMYFVAKSLKSIEAGKEATFGNAINIFFMLWFFPIGLWWLQPKVNKML